MRGSATTTEKGIRSYFGYLIRLYIVTVAINYIWEMAQMPLYESMPYGEVMSWLLCFRASLGDGVIVLTIWGIGAALYRSFYWFRRLTVVKTAILVISGSLIAVAIELHALGSARWAYTPWMPIVPYVEIGWSPFAQLIVLPWPLMILADRWSNRKRRRS